MRHRNNLYRLIVVFVVLSLVIIFLATTMTIQRQSEKMEQQQQIEATRLREKEESLSELALLVYEEPQTSEDPLVEETLKAVPMSYYENERTLVPEEPSYDGEGGLECEFKDDVERLACVIYQEAGGDACCDMCRKRVADVVLNRVKDSRFKGATIEEILIDDDPAPQWGLYSVTGVVWPEKATQPSEAHAVERAWETAFDVLEGNHSDLTEDYIWCAEFPQGSNVIECCGIYFGT